MNKNRYVKRLITGILCIIVCLAADHLIPGDFLAGLQIKSFENKIHSKEMLSADLYNSFKNDPAATFEEYFYELTNQGIDFIVFENDTALFWSDHTIPFEGLYTNNLFDHKYKKIGNIWYITQRFNFNNFKIISLIEILKDYRFENQYLKNGIHASFDVPDDLKIFTNQEQGAVPIYCSDGDKMFYVALNDYFKDTFGYKLIYFILFLTGIGFILSYALRNIELKNGNRKKLGFIFWLMIIVYLCTGLLFLFNIPVTVIGSGIFSPYILSLNSFIPSLGHLIFYTGIFLFGALLFFNHISIRKMQSLPPYLALVISFFVLISSYIVVCIIIQTLIKNSTIPFSVFQVDSLNLNSVFGYLVIAMYYIILALISGKILKYLRQFFPLKSILLIIVIATLILMVISGYFGILSSTDWILWGITTLSYFYFISPNTQKITYAGLVSLVIAFSAHSTLTSNKILEQKNHENLKVIAINLSSEHDPVAELLLENLEQKIVADSVLHQMLFYDDFLYDNFYTHLTKNYFSGYLNRYDVQLTICEPTDSVYVSHPDNKWYPCYPFFNELMTTNIIRLENSNFYFLDNFSGRINYFGRIKFYNHNGAEVTLFIDLTSKLTSIKLGYPELLIDEKRNSINYLRNYSYAKYHNDELIAQTGSFPYSLFKNFSGSFTEFRFVEDEDYLHCVYNLDEENTIVVSSPATDRYNYLISFAYIFCFFFVTINLLLAIFNFRTIRKQIRHNLRTKIQLTIILVLVLSFLLIGIGTIILSSNQYNERNYALLGEKIQSVYIELDHKLAYVDTLTQSWSEAKYDNLNQLLIKFSDVFYTDINIYSPNGKLLGSSRNEVFEENLLGEYMNYEAYSILKDERRAEFIHHEKVGKLNYLSAYIPFTNINNELLAYLNLPYFTKQKTLRAEISNLVVALINIYVLLVFLSLSVVVIISDRITKPLTLLQLRLREMKLGEKNVRLNYSDQDEIGKLVGEYNRMVDELEKSAELLAKSEREFAWREMAKQIAHEIKNPLTPMKLSVQHLQRTWKDKQEDFNKHLDRFSASLISQIDTLSSIATAFSNFAKMPSARKEKVNLLQVLNEVKLLFINQIDFVLHETDNLNRIFIVADKEQISRVFINLIKNAIQSIPKSREGIVEIIIEPDDENNLIIAVKDNGSGVSDEMKENLFRPNFTTKTSGMGLGLAITKNIIETMDGKISYETSPDGSTFYVTLPKHPEI